MSKEIPLTQGKFAIVDDEDYEQVSKYKWYAHKEGNRYYAIHTKYLGGGRKNQKAESIKMHRLIMKAQKGQEIDHHNGNGLDNRKSNVRFCTHSQNCYNKTIQTNTSKYKGVYWNKSKRKWQSTISCNYKHIYLGRFDNENEAARVYDNKAKELFGEFAYLNFS